MFTTPERVAGCERAVADASHRRTTIARRVRLRYFIRDAPRKKVTMTRNRGERGRRAVGRRGERLWSRR